MKAKGDYYKTIYKEYCLKYDTNSLSEKLKVTQDRIDMDFTRVYETIISSENKPELRSALIEFIKMKPDEIDSAIKSHKEVEEIARDLSPILDELLKDEN